LTSIKHALPVCCILLFTPTTHAATDAGSADGRPADAVAVAPTAEPPQNIDEAIGVGKKIVASARGGHWALMVGLIIMLVTSIVNRLLKGKIPKTVLPWLAILLGILGEGALALHHSGDWVAAIFAGLAAGASAGGAYSAFGKYLPVIGKPKAT
jgi:hypothetical protein